MRGFNNLNPLFGSLMVSNRARKVGQPGRRRSRFDGGSGPIAPSDSVNSYYRSQNVQNTINMGRRSHHNVETPLHNNAVVLKLVNTDAANRADIVLTAGQFDTDPRYQPQVITDGSNPYPNDAGDNVEVDVSCEFGVDGTTQAWGMIQDWIKTDGLAITSTRLEWQTNAQKMHKIRFIKKDLFGDHTLDHIFPQVYYNASQYHDKLVQSDVKFALTRKTVVKYSLEPSEEVLITFWVNGIYEDNRVLEDYVRTQGGNSLS